MILIQNKLKISIMPIAIALFFLTILLRTGGNYKILSSHGKVKVKIDGQVMELQGKNGVILNKDDAIMLYHGAGIKLQFPGNTVHRFEGPLYTSIHSLKSLTGGDKKNTFFNHFTRWRGLKHIFDEEGENPVTRRRGDWVFSMQFYNDIRTEVSAANIFDTALSNVNKKKLKTVLAEIRHLFNAFSKPKQSVIQGLVYKYFGLHKTALSMVFSNYKKILHLKRLKEDRAIMEDYLIHTFIPIVVHVQSLKRERGAGNNRAFKLPLAHRQTLTANLDLWWAVFLVENGKLKPLGKSSKTSILPQKTYTLNKQVHHGMDGDTPPRPSCFIVAASPQSSLLDKYDNLELARKELLNAPTVHTKGNLIQAFTMIVVRTCF